MNWARVNHLSVNKRQPLSITHCGQPPQSLQPTQHRPGSMATSQLISFYASLTAPFQLWEINGTGSIRLLTQTHTQACMYTHTHTFTQTHTYTHSLSELSNCFSSISSTIIYLLRWQIERHPSWPHNQKQAFCHCLLPLPCRRLKQSTSH